MKTKPELVLPAGDLHRVKIAFTYGADAIYVGLDKYSLRKTEVRFTIPQIKKAILYAHGLDKKIYVTFNIFAHNSHLKTLEKDMKTIAKFTPDAFIISDPGIVALAQKVAPKIPIHLSTQANTINIGSVRFWYKQGIKRIVLGRELNLKEITEIKKAAPKMELEIFVHGAMCISYSGRCLLSAAMTGRSANLGQCAQPCRWNYKLTNNPSVIPSEAEESLKDLPAGKTGISPLVSLGRNDRYYFEEAKRPGEFFPIEEDEKGTYIMNSKDLCLVEHLDKIVAAGVTGLKIEGRNKTDFYVATTARAYRQALASVTSNLVGPGTRKKQLKPLRKELENLTHRDYTTGFLLGDAEKGETFKSREPIPGKKYLGFVEKRKTFAVAHLGGESASHLRGGSKSNRENLNKLEGYYQVVVKNKLKIGKKYELLTPDEIITFKITEMLDITKKPITVANPGRKDEKVYIKTDKPLLGKFFIREF